MQHILQCSGHALRLPKIVKGSGVHVYDEAGKAYVDLTSGVWCVGLGHQPPRLSQVLARQARDLMHAGFCYSHPVVDGAGEAVVAATGLAPGKCLFLSSGSEAVEVLRQASAHLAGRQKTLALHDAYFGSYASTVKRQGDWHHVDWQACEACAVREACDSDCPTISSIPKDITEFLFEPGSASGFVRFPPQGLVRMLVEHVRGNGGRVIVNEVTTGMGRTGKWFGFQHYGIQPDMVALGKGIGNGYPVSAAVVSQGVAAELESTGFKYAQSHQNDPLGAAIAREVIEIFKEEDWIARSQQAGELFLEQLQDLVDQEVVLAVRGRGMMFGVDLAGPEFAGRIWDHLLDRGYIVCNRGSLFRIDPPLIADSSILNGFIDAFQAGIAAVKKG